MNVVYFKAVLGIASAGICAMWAVQCAGSSIVPIPVIDLNPGTNGSYPSNFTAFAESIDFSAYTVPTGRELWRLSGTNVSLVRDINDTADDLGGGFLEGNDSVPQYLTPFGSNVYFSAFDPHRGGELWRDTGTNASRVADINPDSNDNIKTSPNNSWPNQLTVLSNTLYFSANSGTQKPNYELWKFDGLSVTQAVNIHPDSGNDGSSYPSGITPFADALYFMADDGTNGYELWKWSGNKANLLTNINPGGSTSSSFPKAFTPFRNELYFQAYDLTNGFELWKTDGTNTSLVADINPGTPDGNPEFLTVCQGALYFRATDAVHGYELWKYDGTNTSLAADINPTSDSFPKNLAVFNDTLFFTADDGIHGWELWRFDGTSASLVADLNPAGDSFPESLIPFNGFLCFVATTPDTGYELWTFDGEEVRSASDINLGSGDSYPGNLLGHGDKLIFSATQDGISNWEPWTLTVSPLKIISVQRLADDLHLTWRSLAPRTNFIQAAAFLNGPYIDISGPIILQGNGVVITNFLRSGVSGDGNTNEFYRVIQE